METDPAGIHSDKWSRLFWRKNPAVGEENVGITHPRPDAAVGMPPPLQGGDWGAGADLKHRFLDLAVFPAPIRPKKNAC